MTLTATDLDRDDVLLQLKLTIARAIARQEKPWGYFRIQRLTDGTMAIDIPHLPRLRFSVNLDRDIYKVYWGRAEKPAIYTRKKRKNVTDPRTRQTQVQRVYEVTYQLDGRTSVRAINRLVAYTIRDRVTERVEADTSGEMKPLVLVSEAST